MGSKLELHIPDAALLEKKKKINKLEMRTFKSYATTVEMLSRIGDRSIKSMCKIHTSIVGRAM